MADDPNGSVVLSSSRIRALPPSFFYIPNFISEEEEVQLLNQIPSNRWVTLTHRRLQAHPSKLTATNTLLSAPLPSFLSEPILGRFKELEVFRDTPHRAPNHVLLNEYKRGEGIMTHEDGAAYAPVVATVSLGTSIILNIVEKAESVPESTTRNLGSDGDGEQGKIETEPAKYRILQEPRSLLITTGEGYTEFLHGIADLERDEGLGPDTIANWELLGNPEQFKSGLNERGTRISLTYRDVLKVSNAGSKILGLGKR
ncbi:calpain [Viridothelium virens]|uniref:Calpain n=1 Tax=Viridothelium virens TaxID=1048519 RepID=A0A6A6H4G7_VIRVR|nr:calpain [Viridothelium virens]